MSVQVTRTGAGIPFTPTVDHHGLTLVGLHESEGDSVHLPAGTVRSISAGTGPATVLGVRAS